MKSSFLFASVTMIALAIAVQAQFSITEKVTDQSLAAANVRATLLNSDTTFFLRSEQAILALILLPAYRQAFIQSVSKWLKQNIHFLIY